MTYKIGQIIKGKITGIQPYGAFVSFRRRNARVDPRFRSTKSGYTKVFIAC